MHTVVQMWSTTGTYIVLQVQERGLLMLSESGIFTPDDVAYVQKCGCGGILVGESLVKQPDTTVAVQQLLA
jgi:indole-3-glycerol phosphate synthase